MTRRRPPFKIVGNTISTYRRDGRFVTTGRTSFVWETLVTAIASGVGGVHEIRRRIPEGPWHTIEMSVAEAEEWLGRGLLGKGRVERARRRRARQTEREGPPCGGVSRGRPTGRSETGGQHGG